MKGDNYQGRFFWYHAAGLLFQDSHVERVVIEHDTVSGVDDVVVYYKGTGILDSNTRCTAQYFQVKYHVDHRDAYSSDAMIDPGFINAKTSLLKRFYDAFLAEREKHPGLVLALVSNWTWRSEDVLATAIRDCDGTLPDAFFSRGPKSALGMIREKWKSAVNASDDEFEDFARRLRLKLNYFSRSDLLRSLSDRLYRAGLRPIDEAKQVVPYDDLATKFVTSGPRDFNASTLRSICAAEGLVIAEPQTRDPRAIGIRSFMRFAEHLEDECDRFVCLAQYFDGRSIRDRQLWGDRVLPALHEFLSTEALRQAEHHVLLECHLSVAYAAGYILHRASGASVYPLQKGRARAVWKPAVSPPPEFAHAQWMVERAEQPDGRGGLVLAVSVTHDVHADVNRHLHSAGVSPRVFLHLRPLSGVGASSVQGADHAAALAEQLQQLVMKERRRIDEPVSLHLFAAAPNGFMYFLGQLGRALDPAVLYEYDFDGHSGYSQSFTLPLRGAE